MEKDFLHKISCLQKFDNLFFDKEALEMLECLQKKCFNLKGNHAKGSTLAIAFQIFLHKTPNCFIKSLPIVIKSQSPWWPPVNGHERR